MSLDPNQIDKAILTGSVNLVTPDFPKVPIRSKGRVLY